MTEIPSNRVTWFQLPADDVDRAWGFRVDDVDGTLEKIVAAGGNVALGRTEIPEIAMVFATFEDTEGNLVNIVGDL